MEAPISPFAEFLQSNSSAIFAFLGVILGGILSYLANRSLSVTNLRLRLREKLLEKRILAHEQTIELAKTLRTMVNLGEVDADGELVRSPYFLTSMDAFREHQSTFSSLFGHNSTWLSIELTRELNLVQDYFVNLDLILRRLPPALLPSIGNMLRDDFVAFSSSTEKMAYSFFEKDLEKLSLSSLSDWHKYPIEETERRLSQTALFRLRGQIRALAEQQT